MGIDPSYSGTGVVILDAQYKVISYSLIRLPQGPQRLLRAGKALHTQLKVVQGFGLAVLEDAAYGAPSRITVGKLKELSGVYKFILEAHGIEWCTPSPSEVKKHVTGWGRSEKHMVAKALYDRYAIRFDNDKGYDLSDAASLAIWGIENAIERASRKVS